MAGGATAHKIPSLADLVEVTEMMVVREQVILEVILQLKVMQVVTDNKMEIRDVEVVEELQK